MAALYGIIGFPLGHSFSPGYFNKKFEREGIDARYESFELPSLDGFGELIRSRPELKGLNVTIPYKQAVIPLLDRLSDAAAEIGAVNCISIGEDGLTGYNTDVIGFEQSLCPFLKPHHDKALILGTGGSAAAVRWVLQKLGISAVSVSRERKHGAISYEDIDRKVLEDHLLIVNTTPAGMYPDIQEAPPLPYQLLTERHLLFDLIYNPPETLFLSRGKQAGATTENGLEMLRLQAEAAWDIWNR